MSRMNPSTFIFNSHHSFNLPKESFNLQKPESYNLYVLTIARSWSAWDTNGYFVHENVNL